MIENAVLGREKNTDKILEAIEDSKKNNPAKLLTGFGIFGIGTKAANDLIKNFKSIDAIVNATDEDLIAVPDLGEISVNHIKSFFNDEINLKMLDELKMLGLNMNAEVTIDNSNDFINGKIFVLTGTLVNYSRSEATKIIEDHGGKVSNSVSKKTDYVIAGDNSGSKLQKAAELKIKILDEDEFMKLIKT